uniref:Uncharacterized protein n=1 Tax=Grammatophora oceanica TaxID=210454 RepID=A0A7S1UZ34_9STRA
MRNIPTVRCFVTGAVLFSNQLLGSIAAFTVAPSPSSWTVVGVRVSTTRPSLDSTRPPLSQRTPASSTRTPTRIWSTLGSSDMELLHQRVRDMRISVLEDEMARPPNAELSPTEFVRAILMALKCPDDPVPDSGLRMLLRASTKNWRSQVYQAIGASPSAVVEEDVAASALGAALARPKNQFGILVGAEDSEDYYLDITSMNELDFQDGSCWVECRLRQKDTDKLLAVLGWELEQRLSDKAWVVDGIQWQDFRDDFRPGIGREEWMRVCG